MMRLIAMIVLLAVVNVQAQPTLQAVRTALTPRIDGVLDEACWQGDFAGGFTTLTTQLPADPKTAIAIAYDQTHLYVAVRCDEPHMDELVENIVTRDGPVYGDDAIELMLMAVPQLHPDPNYIEYVHLIFNTANVQQDLFMRGGAVLPWDGIWQSAVHHDEDGWSAEIAIAFSNLPITDQTRSTWRFNVARQRKANRTQLSAFAPVENGFHTASEFASLAGVDVDFARYRIDVVGVDVVGSGDAYTVRVNWRNDSELDGPLRIEAALVGADGIPQLRNATTTTQPGTGGIADVGPFNPGDSGDYDVYVLLKDESGAVRRQVWLNKTIDISPLQLTMRRPWYRNSIYVSQDIDAVLVDAVVNLAADQLAAHQLVAVIEHEDGRGVGDPVQSQVDGGSMTLELPLPADLAAGEYRVAVALRKGDEDVALEHVVLVKLPPAPGREVRLDDHCNITIDGDPFFPLGFMGANVNCVHLAENGYNTLHTYTLHYEKDIEKIRQTLDAFDAAGMKVIFSPFHQTASGFTGVRIGKNKYRSYFTDEEIERTRIFVRELRDHPALLGWYLCDEPRGAAWHQALEKMYHLIAETDPYHPVIALDNGPLGCVELQSAADVVWLDPYPDFLTAGGSASPVSIVSRGIETIQQGLKRPVAVWLAQQTFDRGDFRPDERDKWRSPTYIEERCMAYMGLVEGAKAIIPYKIGSPDWEPGTPTGNRGIYSSAEMRIGMLEGVGPELAQLAPVVMMADSTRQVQCDQDVVLTLLKEDDGHLYLIAVNTSTEAVTASITLDGAGSRGLHVFWENRDVQLSNGVLTDAFDGLAVHVYTTDPALRSDRTVADVVRMIEAAQR
jgi:hypothetical protein